MAMNSSSRARMPSRRCSAGAALVVLLSGGAAFAFALPGLSGGSPRTAPLNASARSGPASASAVLGDALSPQRVLPGVGLLGAAISTGLAAFLVLSSPARGRGARAESATSCRAEGDKINKKIEPESPKVVTKEDLDAGDKKVYCRCWLSDTFPLCNGAHAKHNGQTGDNVGPLIVSVKK
ncbi:unnamed protein product [Polarella glacialis]|uniref:Iron-binding zinc finger CDGSH type domain-containing protein n=1 Tax=Polarella glacialis TaxID=89957 RepID=A0A813IN66_POLGL|nr:unnamed protein product [Polarella glacialis]